MLTLAFVCTANMCRSPMAQAICEAEIQRRGLAVRVVSAGLQDFEGVPVIPEARLVCERHGTPMAKAVSTYFRNLDFTTVDVAFVMTFEQLAKLQVGTLLPSGRVVMLSDFDPNFPGDDIEDPTGKDLEAFEDCYRRLRDCVVHFLDASTRRGGAD